MKNIKKLIKNSYHERKIRRLKKVGSFKSDDYHTRPARAIFPLRPSIFAYTVGTIILVVAFIIFGTSGKSQNPGNAHTRAINHLKEHTFTYLTSPIKTVFSEDSGTEINIYYGLTGDEENINQYLLIVYQKHNDVTLDVKVYNNGPSVGGENDTSNDAIFIGNDVTSDIDELIDVEFNYLYKLIKVDLIVDDEIETVYMDLTENYSILISGGGKNHD